MSGQAPPPRDPNSIQILIFAKSRRAMKYMQQLINCEDCSYQYNIFQFYKHQYDPLSIMRSKYFTQTTSKTQKEKFHHKYLRFQLKSHQEICINS